MNTCDNSNFLTVEQALVRIERDLQAIDGFEQLAIRSAIQCTMPNSIKKTSRACGFSTRHLRNR